MLEVIGVMVATNDAGDNEALPDLLKGAPRQIEQVSADGACDQGR